MSCSIRHPEDCRPHGVPITFPNPLDGIRVHNPFDFDIPSLNDIYKNLSNEAQNIVSEFKDKLNELNISPEKYITDLLEKTKELIQLITDPKELAQRIANEFATLYQKSGNIDPKDIGKYGVCTVVVRGSCILTASAISDKYPELAGILSSSALELGASACLIAFPGAVQ